MTGLEKRRMRTQRIDGVEASPYARPMEDTIEQIRRALEQTGVDFALLFGSHADGTARADSDVDVAFWGPAGVDEWDLRKRLPGAVDLVDLRRAPEYLAGRIAMTGIVIVDADPAARVRWQAETRKRYLDEEFRRRQFRRDFARAHG